MIGEVFTAPGAGADPGGTAAAAAALLDQLARASLAGGLVAAAVWCLVRALPRLPAGWRCALWWTASLKLVVALVWVAPIELALLPAPEAATAAEAAGALAETGPPRQAAIAGLMATGGPESGAASGPPPASTAIEAGSRAAEAAPGSPPATALAGRPLPWREGLVLLWLLGVAAGAAGIARELAAVRRLRRASRPATEAGLLALFEELRERLAVRGPVELRLARGIASPLTVGLARPAVILPAGSPEELTRAQLSLALAHELLHVRRRDLWAGWVPAIARRLFFFHPLAALAAREYRLAREAACDAAVVRELGAAPQAYGRLLLLWSAPGGGRMAVAAPSAGTPSGRLPEVGAAAAASPTYFDLKRRLVMLRNPVSIPRGLRAVAWAAVLAAVAALVPLRIVAAPPVPPEPPPAPESPAVPEAPERPAVRLAALTPEAPAVPEPPEAPKAPRVSSTTTNGHSWSWSDDGQAWALVEGAGSNVWMHGSSEDVGKVRRLQGASGKPVLWFRRDGEEYVVRDAATIAEMKRILEPQRELGRQQAELGAQQAKLGEQQAELGAQQAELGGRQAELGRQQGELGARQGELGAQQAQIAAEHAAVAAEGAALVARRAADRYDERSDDPERRAELAARRDELEARRDELEERRDELADRMRELGERQRELGERQAELGRPQAELGREQAKLGVPQAELGRQQAELGKRQAALGERQREAAERARPLIRELFDRAIESGSAEPID